MAAGCQFVPQSNAVAADAGEDADGDLWCATMAEYTPGPSGDHSYRAVSEALTYDQAIARCAADGARLAIIGTSEENDFVGALIQDPVWLGYNDLDREGMYTWVDGSAPGFESWAGTAPANESRDCVIQDSGGIWDDRECGEMFAFVCECAPAQRAPATPECMDNEDYETILAGRRYQLLFDLDDSAMWQEAQQVCAADGAYLVAIADEYENGLLRGLGNGNRSLWIGYSDTDTESIWEWVNGVQQREYEPWLPGEPNNFDGIEDCAELLVVPEAGQPGGRWNDVACDQLLPYACECD
ncbi:MAG: C-type lectin domain-containing protein, partial [Myxococcota bacterium]